MAYAGAQPRPTTHDNPCLAVLAYANAKGWRRIIEVRTGLFEALHDDIGQMNRRHIWLFFGSAITRVGARFHERASESRAGESQ
jgi:hypothetical protein